MLLIVGLQYFGLISDEKTASEALADKASRTTNFTGLNICPIRMHTTDSFSHILFFDTEALVIELLAFDKYVVVSLMESCINNTS